MATALFINRTDLVKNSIIDGNVDTNKFIQFVKIAQEIHIRNYTGSKLYDKLQSDILGSGLSGAYQTLVNTLVNKERNLAEYYTTRMIDYITFNQSSFPEYNTNVNEDIYPDKDSLFNGWVL